MCAIYVSLSSNDLLKINKNVKMYNTNNIIISFINKY